MADLSIGAYELVDTSEGLRSALRCILDARQSFEAALLNSRTPLLYVDIEGEDLCRNGTIALIQIHISLIRKTFIIDVCSLGPSAFGISVPATTADLSSDSDPDNLPFPHLIERDPITLKTVLESSAILKCFFDCR